MIAVTMSITCIAHESHDIPNDYHICLGYCGKYGPYAQISRSRTVYRVIPKMTKLIREESHANN